MNTKRDYVLSPYALLLRDKPNLFKQHTKQNKPDEAIKLEQYINDVYHHFLYILTREMQAAELSDETRLRALFEELIKHKKELQNLS